MVMLILLALGLCFGSFVGALTYRIYEQDKAKSQLAKGKTRKKSKKTAAASTQDLSIVHGRSMCEHCHHELAAADLLPVVSWVLLMGKCRYCRYPISWQNPALEIVMAGLFVASYHFWPQPLHGGEIIVFGIWLVLLIGLVALTVYDLRWFLLPNRLVFPLFGVAACYALARAVVDRDAALLGWEVLGVIVGGGIFYLLFEISKGKWIGGGDVKLGGLLGLVVGGPIPALLFIFLASVAGTVISVPLLATGKASRSSKLPFGPFLILGGIITVLFGASILHWYNHQFLVL